MSNVRKIKKRIQHNADRLAMKVNLVPLEVTMAGCQLFVAVPDEPGKEPEKIKKRVRASMAEMQDRANRLTVRDVYEYVVEAQQMQKEVA